MGWLTTDPVLTVSLTLNALGLALIVVLGVRRHRSS
jgi:hypothetical protein